MNIHDLYDLAARTCESAPRGLRKQAYYCLSARLPDSVWVTLLTGVTEPGVRHEIRRLPDLPGCILRFSRLDPQWDEQERCLVWRETALSL